VIIQRRKDYVDYARGSGTVLRRVNEREKLFSDFIGQGERWLSPLKKAGSLMRFRLSLPAALFAIKLA